jgi:hypothetical protein
MYEKCEIIVLLLIYNFIALWSENVVCGTLVVWYIWGLDL